MIDRWFASCLLVLLGHVPAEFASAETYGSGWYREIQMCVSREDNASRGYRSADRIPDTVTTAGLGLGYSGKFRHTGQFILSGYLAYNDHRTVGDISNLAASLGARLLWQGTPGYDHAWLDTGATVTRLAYRNSEARDGYLLEYNAAVNRRLGMRATGRVGYRYHGLAFPQKSYMEKLRDAAFDTARHEIFVGVDYELGTDLYLVGEYAYQRGEFTSAVSGMNPMMTYAATTRDPAFEQCTMATCPPWWAYRTDGHAHALDLGLAFSLHGMDYDVSSRYYSVTGEGGTRYHDWFLQFGAIWNF